MMERCLVDDRKMWAEQPLKSCPLLAVRQKEISSFYAIGSELFGFHIFRFSTGETAEEAARKWKSKSY
jgi:hypothetical protein